MRLTGIDEHDAARWRAMHRAAIAEHLSPAVDHADGEALVRVAGEGVFHECRPEQIEFAEVAGAPVDCSPALVIERSRAVLVVAGGSQHLGARHVRGAWPPPRRESRA